MRSPNILLLMAMMLLSSCQLNKDTVDITETKIETSKESTESRETRYTYEEPTLSTNSVYNETYTSFKGVYEETEPYLNRFPDKELPDMEEFMKDAYGNYVITETMFEDKVLPLNSEGVIEYISYFDENGIMLNPMPIYYNNYLGYFASYGG